MRSRAFLTALIVCNVGIIVMQINNHARIVRQRYTKQRNEKIKKDLLAKKTAATRNLCVCKNHAYIKKYAITHLHMQPIALSQIKSVSFNE